MSMDEFIKTLTEEQKRALLEALSGGEVPDEPSTTHPPFIASSEETISESVDGDFTMNKGFDNSKNRSKVKAGKNTWTDTGEAKDVATPHVARTPRNRSTPKKKNVKCHACGKTFQISPSLMFGEYYRCDRCSGNS